MFFFQREEYLHRVDGFEQVVGNLRADGLVHQVLGLVFRHHHHGYVGLLRLNASQGFKTRKPWHVLVEQHEVETSLAAKVDGIGTVRTGGYFVAFLL